MTKRIDPGDVMMLAGLALLTAALWLWQPVAVLWFWGVLLTLGGLVASGMVALPRARRQ